MRIRIFRSPLTSLSVLGLSLPPLNDALGIFCSSLVTFCCQELLQCGPNLKFLSGSHPAVSGSLRGAGRRGLSRCEARLPPLPRSNLLGRRGARAFLLLLSNVAGAGRVAGDECEGLRLSCHRAVAAPVPSATWWPRQGGLCGGLGRV